MGSVVNVSTRAARTSSTVEAHWWLRNAAFDAPTIFQNRAGQGLPIYQDNRYGFASGGPVIIPEAVNGKNKTFWHFTWEANKFGDPNDGQLHGYRADRRGAAQGDFSDLLALGRRLPGLRSERRSGGRGWPSLRRQPFPGNIIPPNRLIRWR